MRLLIVSHTAHYRHDDGFAGWGPTIREIDALASVFDEIVHVAPLYDGPPPTSVQPYSSLNVTLRFVRPSGGNSAASKLGILAQYPSYAKTILQEVRGVDAVHVRCPANIALLTLLLLSFVRDSAQVRWFKYAGNWCRYDDEPLSYRLQRQFLKWAGHSGVVTVNGEWPDQSPHVRSFLNPCLTDRERRRARRRTADKTLHKPVRLLFVGRLEEAKGVYRVLKILEDVNAGGLDAELALVGDGPGRRHVEEAVASSSASDRVTMHGWISREDLGPIYEAAHFMLLPSTCSEGWPKVLSEGMAYGLVPLASNLSSIPQYLRRFKVGRALNPLDVAGFANAVRDYAAKPDVWLAESLQGKDASQQFTYGAYLAAVRDLLGLATTGSDGDPLHAAWGSGGGLRYESAEAGASTGA